MYALRGWCVKTVTASVEAAFLATKLGLVFFIACVAPKITHLDFSDLEDLA